MPGHFVVFLLLLGFSPRPPGSTPLADTYPRQAGVDATHYRFQLVLSDDKDAITGEATVDFRFTAASVRAVELDLASANAGKGMTVTGVTSPQGAVQFQHASDRLRVT